MESFTFENLPKAVSELNRKMDLILSQTQNQKQENQDRLFTIEQFLAYLPEKPARQTVYGWVNNRTVPFEKHGKKLYFRKSVIDRWLLNARKV